MLMVHQRLKFVINEGGREAKKNELADTQQWTYVGTIPMSASVFANTVGALLPAAVDCITVDCIGWGFHGFRFDGFTHQSFRDISSTTSNNLVFST